MPQPFPSITNSTRLFELFQYADTVSNNMMGNIFVFLTFVIGFSIFKLRATTAQAGAAAGSITTTIAILFWYMGIVNPLAWGIPLIITVVSIFGIYMEKPTYY